MLMKPNLTIRPVILGLLKLCVMGLIAFAIFGLFLQFIFSYSSQSTYGQRLTVLNFAVPLLLTIIMLVIFALRLVLKTRIKNNLTLNIFIKSFLAIIFLILLGWQIWYLVTLYKIKSDTDVISKMTELLPIVLGGIATLYLATISVIKKHAS